MGNEVAAMWREESIREEGKKNTKTLQRQITKLQEHAIKQDREIHELTILTQQLGRALSECIAQSREVCERHDRQITQLQSQFQPSKE